MTERALWTVEAMAAAMGAQRQGALPRSVPGISIDSRTLAGRSVLRHPGRQSRRSRFHASAWGQGWACGHRC